MSQQTDVAPVRIAWDDGTSTGFTFKDQNQVSQTCVVADPDRIETVKNSHRTGSPVAITHDPAKGQKYQPQNGGPAVSISTLFDLHDA